MALTLSPPMCNFPLSDVATPSTSNAPSSSAMDLIQKPTTYHDNTSILSANSPDTFKEPLNEFDSYEKRLVTYSGWKNDKVTPEALAKAGFFYTKSGDVVRCSFCGIEGHLWESGDVPLDDHRRWNPVCPFLNRQDSSEDTCGKFNNFSSSTSSSILSQDAFKRLGLQRVQPPAYPQFSSPERRLESFAVWPKSLKQKPSELVDAGFFYANSGDQTLCFSCGGGLKDWEEDDDPWEQHAFWFGSCGYLQLKKGSAYVDKVKGSKKDTTPEAASTVPPAEEAEVTTPPSSSLNETKDNSNETCTTTKPPAACQAPAGAETPSSEKTLCKICYKNELAVVFLPCGHIVACVDCASGMKKCPVCRETLQATVRAFLS